MFRYIATIILGCQFFPAGYCSSDNNFPPTVVAEGIDSERSHRYLVGQTGGMPFGLPEQLQQMFDSYCNALPDQWKEVFCRAAQYKLSSDIKGRFDERYWMFYLDKLNKIIDHIDYQGDSSTVNIENELPLRLFYCAEAIMNFDNTSDVNSILALFLSKDLPYLFEMLELIRCSCFSPEYTFQQKKERYQLAIEFLNDNASACRIFREIIQTVCNKRTLPMTWLLYLREYLDALKQKNVLNEWWARYVREILEDFKRSGGLVSRPIRKIQELCPSVPFCGVKPRTLTNEDVELPGNEDVELPGEDPRPDNYNLLILHSLISREEEKRRDFTSIEQRLRACILQQMLDELRSATNRQEKNARNNARAMYFQTLFEIPNTLARLQTIEEVTERERLEQESESFFRDICKNFSAFMRHQRLMAQIVHQTMTSEEGSRSFLERRCLAKITQALNLFEAQLRDDLDTERLDFMGGCAKALRALVFLQNHSIESIINKEKNDRTSLGIESQKKINQLHREHLKGREHLSRLSIGKDEQKEVDVMSTGYAEKVENELVLVLITKWPPVNPLKAPWVKVLLSSLPEKIRQIYEEYIKFIVNYKCHCMCTEKRAEEKRISDLFERHRRFKTYKDLQLFGPYLCKANFSVPCKRNLRIPGDQKYSCGCYLERYRVFRDELLAGCSNSTIFRYSISYVRFILDIVIPTHVSSGFIDGSWVEKEEAELNKILAGLKKSYSRFLTKI